MDSRPSSSGRSIRKNRSEILNFKYLKSKPSPPSRKPQAWRVESPRRHASPRLAIRRARLADVPALLTIEHTCFPPQETLAAAQVRRLLRNPRAICLAAVGDAKTTQSNIAGWCVAFIRRHAHCRSGRIYTLAVDPMLHRQGVGRQLLTRMLAMLRQRGVGRVYLEVRAENRRAIAMYEEAGFEKMRRLPGHYGDGGDGVSMRMSPV